MTRASLARPVAITWVDVLVALGTSVAAVVGTEFLVRASPSAGPLEPAAYALLIATGLPLLLRDRHPVPVLLVVAASAVVYTWLAYPGGFYTIGLVFATWAAVAAGYRLVAFLTAAVVVADLAVAGLVLSEGHATDADAPVWFLGWLLASFVLGEVSRGRREHLEQVEHRALEAERTREEEARRRADEERVRIARELHDVLGHHISVISVQAGVALHLLDRQPEQARTALVTINGASKEALRELRATLGMLRRADESAPRDPTPSLDDLDELVARTASTGLAVDVERAGEPRPLPLGTDLAAYRIVQESLTNVARHAQATRVHVSIRYGPELVIEVADDGRAGPTEQPILPGNGLTGMRERAAAVGGTLEAGPRPEGGFIVRATLPMDGPA